MGSPYTDIYIITQDEFNKFKEKLRELSSGEITKESLMKFSQFFNYNLYLEEEQEVLKAIKNNIDYWEIIDITIFLKNCLLSKTKYTSKHIGESLASEIIHSEEKGLKLFKDYIKCDHNEAYELLCHLFFSSWFVPPIYYPLGMDRGQSADEAVLGPSETKKLITLIPHLYGFLGKIDRTAYYYDEFKNILEILDKLEEPFPYLYSVASGT